MSVLRSWACDLALRAEDFESYAAFVGPDYGVVTDESCEALHLVAQQEGLLLDPSYTSKAMRRAFGACARRLVASRAEPYLSPYRRYAGTFCVRQGLGLLMQLPTPDPTRFKRREALIGRLREHLRADQIIHHREDVVAYECDGLSAYRQRPMLVALPDSTEQVRGCTPVVLRTRHSHRPLGGRYQGFRAVPCRGKMESC